MSGTGVKSGVSQSLDGASIWDERHGGGRGTRHFFCLFSKRTGILTLGLVRVAPPPNLERSCGKELREGAAILN